jgi:hypothetical protein
MTRSLKSWSRIIRSTLLLLLALGLLVSSGSALAQSESLPDPRLTPGATLSVSASKVCTIGYTKTARAVPDSLKRAVYAAYGREPERGVCCEIDHLIPLELGGSNELSNLWPQRYDIEWNATRKDRLERRLHAMVCSGQLSLKAAQEAIGNDWVAAYLRFVVR